MLGCREKVKDKGAESEIWEPAVDVTHSLELGGGHAGVWFERWHRVSQEKIVLLSAVDEFSARCRDVIPNRLGP